MDYSRMVEDALRGVVRRALDEAAHEGLKGNHHFYVTFLTRYPGVSLPDHLLARYETDITIVLQHQYWDLAVDAEAFEVSLSFNKLPTRIRVPFAAITSFADPSVQFGLQFQPPGVPGQEDAALAPRPAPEPAVEMVEDEKPEAPKAGEVVSLDAFRTKR
ncbi:MAG: ClpXP protease specificity-enhancing factor SspB [Pseudomonadota bacterium]|nr:ClpXP protease specificity-enhancing factor SspB [Pseudomonadota bacterium]